MPRTLHTFGEYPPDWAEIAHSVKEAAGWKCIRCDRPHHIENRFCLTVHHFDGNKSNCIWWNLLALCQRCHLRFQGRVNPDQPYMFMHSDWLKPYVAGFYANKYQGRKITRSEAIEQMTELLDLERIA